MTTLDSLYAGLAQAPEDWQARSVLADWYEESGLQEAADALRWTNRQKKRPFHSTMGTYSWFNVARVTNDEDPASNLPESLYLQMPGEEKLAKNHRTYETLRAAYEDLFAGWSVAMQQGWNADA